MIALTVTVSEAQRASLARAMAEIPAQIPKILRTSVNDSMKFMQTQLARLLSVASGFRQRDLKRVMRTQWATNANPTARVTLKDRRPLITAFKARRYKKGLTYQAGGERVEVPGGFFQTLHKTRIPLQRVGASRYPLRVLRGPSLLAKLDDSLLTTLQRGASEKLGYYLEQKARWLLEKGRS